VPELHDQHIRAGFLEEAREQRKMIVLNPHSRRFTADFGHDDLGKFLIKKAFSLYEEKQTYYAFAREGAHIGLLTQGAAGWKAPAGRSKQGVAKPRLPIVLFPCRELVVAGLPPACLYRLREVVGVKERL